MDQNPPTPQNDVALVVGNNNNISGSSVRLIGNIELFVAQMGISIAIKDLGSGVTGLRQAYKQVFLIVRSCTFLLGITLLLLLKKRSAIPRFNIGSDAVIRCMMYTVLILSALTYILETLADVLVG